MLLERTRPRTGLQQAIDDYQELRGIWRKDPVLYARMRIGINPTKQQQQMLEAIAPTGSKVSIRAGHGVGKTTGAAIAIWWHLECFDYCRIPCTAPTASQLYNVLWAEIGKTCRRADDKARHDKLEEPFYLSKLFKINQDKIYDPTPQSDWYAIARTARKDQPDALQGFHASDVMVTESDELVQLSEAGGSLMFVIEEASGVPDNIFEVAEGTLSSHRIRLLMVGNPTKNSGFFARSHTKDRSLYTTLHFACKDSPLADEKYRENLVRKYGEDSNVVRVRADGEFPKQDDDVLIPLEHAEAALERDFVEPYGKKILGVDVARFGDDRTTFIVRQGRCILHVEVHSKQDTMETTGQTIDLARRFGVDDINVDVIGVGSGVVDRLKEQGVACTGVNVADAASLRPKTSDRFANLTPDDKFGRQDMVPRIMRDYLWLEMKDWFADEEPILCYEGVSWKDHAQDLAGEVASVKYKFDSSGKITVEPKDDMKKRGLRSPDLADALALTFAPNKMSIWERLAG